MKYFVKLSYVDELDEKILANSGLIQVLLGPRQVGKTTSILALLQQSILKNSVYVSADQVFHSSPEWVMQQWHQAHSQEKLLVIDEIQKCENWAETLKMLYDESKLKNIQVRCVILGSSSLEIQKGLTESLTGRFQLTRAYHWNYLESKKGYDLSFEEFLKVGGYPGAYIFKKNREWADYVRNSIISTLIEKDILQYRNVKSPALFRQAFEILISYPAQEISFTKILGQLQDRGNVEIIKNYLHLFEGAFLIKTLEKYSAKVIKTKLSSPKILPLAPCFYFLTILEKYRNDERGRVFEMLVGAQLVRTGEKLYYWREGKYEVDFILERGRRLWAIEVKSGAHKTIKGLMEFKKKFPHAETVIIDEENYFLFEEDPLLWLENSNRG